MALAGLGALFFLGMALLLQSPRALRRMGWSNASANKRLPSLTGYAFALLLLAFGFFLAGVPLGQDASAPEIVVVTATPGGNDDSNSVSDAGSTAGPSPTLSSTSSTGESSSGAFPGPLADDSETITATQSITNSTEADSESQTAPTATPSPTSTPEGTLEPTNSPTPTSSPTVTPTPTATSSPTPTPTSTPTTTPTPTLTPTPIVGETATINTEGSTLWMYRSPGGAQLVVLQDQEIVILLGRQANQGGELWSEVETLAGEVGWVRAIYLEEN